MLVQGQIHISVMYKPVSQDPSWGAGVLGSGKGMEDEVQDGEVPHVYFPMRNGCRVTMYNDAHQVSAHATRSHCSQACCPVCTHSACTASTVSSSGPSC